MKRKVILSLCALLLTMSLCLTSAMAKGGSGGRPTPTPDRTAPPVTYDHVDVRTAGKINLTREGVTKEYALTVTSVRVFVGETELTMTGPHTSESKTYPQEFQSQRGLAVPEGARIRVSCAFSYQLDENETQTGTGSFDFTTADTNCEARQKGVDLTITAALVEEIIESPSPSPSAPSPSPSAPSPSPSAPSPTPTAKPTPTPRYILPQTGETADMWTVMLVLTGLCAVTGAVLLILRRANRQ